MRRSESRSSSHPTVSTPRRAGVGPRLAWLALAGLLALAGCATGEYSMLVTVVGGEKVRVPLGRAGVAPTEEDGIRIESATILPTEDKKQVFLDFAFSDARSRGLQKVTVEDIADDATVLLVEDAKPELIKGRWHAVTPSYASAAERPVKWLLQLDKSVRVYRFTLVFADGRKMTLNQGTIFPDGMKVTIRHMLGEKY